MRRNPRVYNGVLWTYSNDGKRNVRVWRSACGTYYVQNTGYDYRGVNLRLPALSGRPVNDKTFERVADRLMAQERKPALQFLYDLAANILLFLTKRRQ